MAKINKTFYIEKLDKIEFRMALKFWNTWGLKDETGEFYYRMNRCLVIHFFRTSIKIKLWLIEELNREEYNKRFKVEN